MKNHFWSLLIVYENKDLGIRKHWEMLRAKKKGGAVISFFRFVFLFCTLLLTPLLFADKVNIVIASDMVVAPPSIVGRYLKNVSEHFEGEFIYYRVHSLEELVSALQQPQEAIIQSIHFLGVHGFRYENNMDFALQDLDGGQPVFNMQDLIGKIHLTFDKEALIVFDSCDIMPKKMGLQAHKSFQEIAQAFGIKSGFIYGNYTPGSNTTEILLGTPFYDSSSKKEAGIKLAAQAIWPITLPVFAYKDYFESNQGYLYHFNNNGEDWDIQKAHLYAVQKGTLN